MPSNPELVALVDCNSFYVSCERVFNPKLNRLPVVVLSSNDGCIISRSNEAKALGIPMGAPVYQCREIIKRECVKVFSANFSLYGDLSARVMETLHTFHPDIEIYSIDEAFLSFRNVDRKEVINRCIEIRQKVLEWTGIPVSIGISTTKTLAKAANQRAKKSICSNVVSFPEECDDLLKKIPVGDVWGIGSKSRDFLHARGVRTAYEFKNKEDLWIKKNMGVVGIRIAWELRGICCFSPQETNSSKQSITSSRTFGNFITTEEELAEAVSTFTARACEKLREEGSLARFISVYIRTSPHRKEPYYWNQATLLLSEPSQWTPELITLAKKGLKSIFRQGLLYKKAGILLGGLCPKTQVQFDLFSPSNTVEGRKKNELSHLIDCINSRKDRQLFFASEGIDPKWKMRQEMRSSCFTTKWSDLLTIKI